jgi:hypothetical protein
MKHSFLLRGILGVPAAVLAALTVVSVAGAQAAGVTVSPATFGEDVGIVAPGRTLTSTLRIRNNENVERTYFISARDIKSLSEDGGPIFAVSGETTGYELSSWVRVEKGPFTIAAGGSREVPFSITIPANATPGGHFGALTVSAQGEKPQETGLGLGYEVNSLLYIKVAGTVFEDAQLRQFSTDRSIYSSADVSFKAIVANLGNVLVRPHGTIEITNIFGKHVATIPLNESGAAVFPKGTRTFSERWQGDGFHFGRYQAVAGFAYGEEAGSQTLAGGTSFWILPLAPIAIVLGAILLLVIVFLLIVKAQVRRTLKELGASAPRGGAAMNQIVERNRPVSRLLVIIVVLLIVTIVFLGLLFVLFA